MYPTTTIRPGHGDCCFKGRESGKVTSGGGVVLTAIQIMLEKQVDSFQDSLMNIGKRLETVKEGIGLNTDIILKRIETFENNLNRSLLTAPLRGTPNMADIRRKKDLLHLLVMNALSHNGKRKSVKMYIGKRKTFPVGETSMIATEVVSYIMSTTPEEAISLEVLLERNGIERKNWVVNTAPGDPFIPLLKSLVTENDKSMQESLREKWVKVVDGAFPLDCQASTGGLPFYQFPNQAGNPYTLSTQMNILSLLGPLSLELKDISEVINKDTITEKDLDVVSQALERVITSFTLNECLRRLSRSPVTVVEPGLSLQKETYFEETLKTS